MKIDASKLKEVNIPKVIRIVPNERFYAVPNAKGYYLSDYGRLFYGNKRQPIIYILKLPTPKMSLKPAVKGKMVNPISRSLSNMQRITQIGR